MPTILTRAEVAALDRAQAQVTPEQAVALAVAQSAADGWYWLQYVQTRDEADPACPVKPFPRGLSYIRALWDVLNGAQRIVIAKSRQMLVSWEVIAFCTWWARFKPNQVVLWQTKAWEDAVRMVAMPEGGFEGRAQFIETHLPPWMRGPCKFSEGRIQYPNGSMIQALAGGADKVRGLVPSVFVGDEFAHQEEQDGVYCVIPTHRVLRADLTWVPAGSVAIGDTLIGFSEQPFRETRARKWLPAIVTSAGRRVLPVYQLTLSDGTRLTATGEHQWIVSKAKGVRWQRTDQLRTSSRMARQLSVWEPSQDIRAGWLAGFFDGEGCLHHDKNQWRLSATQKEGLVLDRAREYLSALGYRWSESLRPTGCVDLRLIGGQSEVLRFLGEIRPVRLLNKFDVGSMGVCRTASERLRVVSIFGPCLQEVVTLSTSVGTYLAEGFGAHNTAVAPLMQKGAKVVFVSTPNGAGNTFATLWHGHPVGTT